MKTPQALSFTSGAYGYMLTYQGQNIGGAGNANRNPKHWKHARADRAMFAEDARHEIAHLEAGRGQARMRAAIEAIDAAAAPTPRGVFGPGDLLDPSTLDD